MSGKYNRVKGHTFERDCVNELKAIGYGKAKTSRAASRLADDCKIDIVGVFPYAFQCKNMQTYASANELDKIDWESYTEGTDGLEGKEMIPVVLTKANGKQPLAILPWSRLLYLLSLENGGN
jgi:hypothetical protein